MLKNIQNLVSHPNVTDSFPSGHTTLVFAFAISIYLYNKKIGIFLIILSVFVGISRIIVGVHFPLDIFVGFLIGSAVPIIVHYFVSKKQYAKK